MKILLNAHENPDYSDEIWVEKGDKVFATKQAEEFGFTDGKEYEIIDVDFDLLVLKNDYGEINKYSVEYFENLPYSEER